MTDFLVTGASGHLGQSVLHHLITTLKIEPGRIAAASRKPETLSAWAARGVAIRAADFNDAASLDQAFADVKRLLIISTDALDAEGTRLKQHKAAVKAAAKAGVDHIAYTSLPNVETSLVTFAPDHAGTEAAIAQSGVPGWSMLRNSWYFENLFHSIPQALASGQWYSAAGQGKLAHIWREDQALAAATALADGFQGQRTLTLSGSGSYTTDEIAALVSKATGKPLGVVHVPLEGLIQGMIGAGIPAPVATVLGSFDAAIKAGHLDGDSKDFEALTGRKPRTFGDWLTENAGKFTAPAAS
ncbi:SDR family oxidoreductase [Mesorhizobium sp. A623]